MIASRTIIGPGAPSNEHEFWLDNRTGNPILKAFINGEWKAIGGGVLSGNTSDIPENPQPGQMFFNTENNKLIIYNGTEWTSAGGGGDIVTLKQFPQESVNGSGQELLEGYMSLEDIKKVANGEASLGMIDDFYIEYFPVYGTRREYDSSEEGGHVHNYSVRIGYVLRRSYSSPLNFFFPCEISVTTVDTMDERGISQYEKVTYWEIKVIFPEEINSTILIEGGILKENWTSQRLYGAGFWPEKLYEYPKSANAPSLVSISSRSGANLGDRVLCPITMLTNTGTQVDAYQQVTMKFIDNLNGDTYTYRAYKMSADGEWTASISIESSTPS